MRIALDVTAAAKPKRTGIGWYVTYLARGLSDLLQPDDRLYLCTRLSRWKNRRYRLQPANERIRARWFQEPFGLRGRPQLFHGPDFRLLRGARCPLVSTVHDVFSLLSDRWATERFREGEKGRYRDIAARASQVIFPSDCSRREFLEHFPHMQDRATVVWHGVDPAFAPVPAERVEEVRARYRLPERYALYVGEISARKNLPGMARGLAAAGVKVPWVWVGGDSFDADAIQREVRGLEVEVHRPGYVPFSDLPAVYSGAVLLIFVTHHEGFGMPALEAMATGIPAVVSNAGALPEVTGGCCLEAAPDDPDAIGAAVRRLWEDETLRAELRTRGREHAGGLSWERAARETLAVYLRALESPRINAA